jgi:hypothetical protein
MKREEETKEEERMDEGRSGIRLVVIGSVNARDFPIGYDIKRRAIGTTLKMVKL